MKKRIIALILVVATLVLALASCAYSFSKDDLSQYVTVDKAKLDAIFAELKIKDGDFTSDETTRNGRVEDYIYGILAEDVKNGEKVTTGTVGAHDILYYNYYMTAEIGGKTVVFGTSSMKDSNKTSVQFGAFGNKDLNKLIETALAEKELPAVYTVISSGTVASGKQAFVSYTKSYDAPVLNEDGSQKVDDEGKPVTAKKDVEVTYELVTLGEGNGIVAEKLAGATINTAVADFEDNGVTYTKALINWGISAGEELTVTDTPYDKETEVKDVYGDTHKANAETVVTYHVYPVYYNKVETFTADIVMLTLLSVFSTTEKDDDGNDKTVPVLDCFEGHDELLKAFKDLKDAYTTAESAYDKAVSAESTAKTALETAKKAIPEGQEGTPAQKETLEKAQTAYDTAVADTSTKLGEKDTAKKNRDDKLAEVFTAITKEAIEADYRKMVREDLLKAYNEELRLNIAKAVWAAFEDKANVTAKADVTLPEKAVEEMYDRLINSHKYTFYTGTNEATKKTYYSEHKGSFEAYLMTVTTTKTRQDAYAAVRAKAEENVLSIITVYAIAEQFGQKLTDEKIAEYKKTSDYASREHAYGEQNTLAAYQFDVLMDYLLETKVDAEGEVEVNEAGVHQYKNITPVISAE